MRETTLLGTWVRRFLLEHLIGERNLARNTQRSYRDTLCQLIPFVSSQLHKPVDRLAMLDVSAQIVRDFLSWVETSRGCGIATRNQRLAAIHALARFVGEHSPEHIEWCAQVRCIPYKKTTHAVVPYLDLPEIDALLASPDQRTALGRRDYALLLFLYNSGARADEAARLTIGDVDSPSSSVHILGKGSKRRQCPLWPDTMLELHKLAGQRQPQERVFLNRCGQPLTRFGIHAIVERHALKTQVAIPSLATQSASVHTAFGIRQRLTCCARAPTSTRYGHGLDTPVWTRPTSMPKPISRQRPRPWRNATSLPATRPPGGGPTTRN